ncbi:MAG: hypothetical protein M0017_12320, partial [Desulfobacteraceae bacterium]|nr:hypothetical protein [Desulfobacteraceae bacterium]
MKKLYPLMCSFVLTAGLGLTAGDLHAGKPGSCVPQPEVCTDGIDNDCDKAIDCADSDCAADPACAPSSENCKDGIDNDGDGLIDCADANCTGTPECTSTIPAHLTINSYDGPQTCIACHTDAGAQMLNSVHGSWNGATPNVVNIPDGTGKWGQTNNYCTDPQQADFACLKCHVSLVGPPTNLTANDMDCLQCHNDTYEATFNGTVPQIFTSCVDGSQKTYMYPAKEADGKYHKVPRYDLMPAGTTMIELARTVHRPTNASCLLPCHAKAGGSDGAKRGDLGSDMVNPPLTQDVHLSQAGTAKLTCTSCHATVN